MNNSSAKVQIQKILKTSQGPFLNPTTLTANDLQKIRERKSDYYYLIKYDGFRVGLLIHNGVVYSFDREFNVSKTNYKVPPNTPTMILDGERMSKKIKIFDVLFYGSEDIRPKKFTERMEILKGITKRHKLYTLSWFMLTDVYHLSQLDKAMTKSGQLIDKHNGYETDGIILNADYRYKAGTLPSPLCSKFKNLSNQTIDFRVVNIQQVSPLIFSADLLVNEKGSDTLFTETFLTSQDLQKISKNTGKIFEMEYSMQNEIIPIPNHSNTNKFKPFSSADIKKITNNFKIKKGRGQLKTHQVKEIVLKVKGNKLVTSDNKVMVTLKSTPKTSTVVCAILPLRWRVRHYRKDKSKPNGLPTAKSVYDFLQSPVYPRDILKIYGKSLKAKSLSVPKSPVKLLTGVKAKSVGSLPLSKSKSLKSLGSLKNKLNKKIAQKPKSKSKSKSKSPKGSVVNSGSVMVAYKNAYNQKDASSDVELEYKMRNVTKSLFERLLENAGILFKNPKKSSMVDSIYNISPKEKLRESVYNDGKKEYIIKTSIDDKFVNLGVPKHDFKRSLSVEKKLMFSRAHKIIGGRQPAVKRRKERFSFNAFNRFSLDLTIVDGDKYEVEIEYNEFNPSKANTSAIQGDFNKVLAFIRQSIKSPTPKKASPQAAKKNRPPSPKKSGSPNASPLKYNQNSSNVLYNLNSNNKNPVLHPNTGFMKLQDIVLELGDVIDEYGDGNAKLSFVLGVGTGSGFIEYIPENTYKILKSGFTKLFSKGEISISDSDEVFGTNRVIGQYISTGTKYSLKPRLDLGSKRKVERKNFEKMSIKDSSNGVVYHLTREAKTKATILHKLMIEIDVDTIDKFLSDIYTDEKANQGMYMRAAFASKFARVVQKVMRLLKGKAKKSPPKVVINIPQSKKNVGESKKGFNRNHQYQFNLQGWDIWDVDYRQLQIYRAGREIKRIGELHEMPAGVILKAQQYYQSIFSVERQKKGGIMKGRSNKGIFYACLYLAELDSGYKRDKKDFKKKIVKGDFTLKQFEKYIKLADAYIERRVVNKVMTLNKYVEILVKKFLTELKKYDKRYGALEDEVKSYVNDEVFIKNSCTDLILLVLYVNIKYKVDLKEALKEVGLDRKPTALAKCTRRLKELIKERNVKKNNLNNNKEKVPGVVKPNPCQCQCDINIQTSSRGKHFFINEKGMKIYCVQRGGLITQKCKKMCPEKAKLPVLAKPLKLKKNQKAAASGSSSGKSRSSNKAGPGPSGVAKSKSKSPSGGKLKYGEIAISTIQASSARESVKEKPKKGKKNNGGNPIVSEMSNIKYHLVEAGKDENKQIALASVVKNQGGAATGLQGFYKRILDAGMSLSGAKSYKELVVMADAFNVINLAEFFNNVVPDENLVCIRSGNKTPKTYKNKTCKPKQQDKKKKKKVVNSNTNNENPGKMFEDFQNSVQIDFEIDGKVHDVKLLPNGNFIITGAKNPLSCQKIGKLLIAKVNNTQGATENSRFSQVFGRYSLPIGLFSPTKFSIMTNRKTNLKFTSSQSDPHGLRKVYNLIKNQYSELLPSENHPVLMKAGKLPIKIPPATDRTKDIAINLIINNRIFNIAIKPTGNLSVSGPTMEGIESVYKTILSIFNKHFDEISK